MSHKIISFFAAVLMALFLTGFVSAAQTLTVNTNKNSYNLGETIQISGNLKENGSNLANEQIGIQINKPNGELFFIDQTTTDSLGNFYSQVKIPENGITGTYTLYASTSQIQTAKTFSIEAQTCTENWICENWGPCINGLRIRNCYDQNNCGTAHNKPSTSQTCTIQTNTNSAGTGSAGTSSNTGTTANSNLQNNSLSNTSQNYNQTQEQNQKVNQSLNQTNQIENQTQTQNSKSITSKILTRSATPYLLGVFLLLSAVLTYIQIKKKSSKKGFTRISYLFILFFLLIFPSVSAYDIQITRNLPDRVNPLQEFNVSISVNFDESNKPASAIVTEKIPDGFTVVDLGNGYYDREKNTIKWLFMPLSSYLPVQDTILTYKLKAPNSNQIVAFNGVLNVGNETYETKGDTILAVGCIESWSCGEWSNCINGVQKRSCIDKNNCGTTKNKPTTIRNCLVSRKKQTNNRNKSSQSSNITPETSQSTNQNKSQINSSFPKNQAENQSSKLINAQKNQTKNETKNTTQMIGNVTAKSIALNSILLFLIVTTTLLISLNFRKNKNEKRNKLPWEDSISKFRKRQ